MVMNRHAGPLGRVPDLSGRRKVISPRIHKLYFASGSASVQLAPTAVAKRVKPKALVLVGDDLTFRKGVKHNNNKMLNKALRKLFVSYISGFTLKIVYVKTNEAMLSEIESNSWDAVIYFGHGVTNAQKLAPGEAPYLSKESLAKSLKKANPKQVYLVGCRSGWTGLARSLSRQLKSTTVFGTFNDVDISWEQRGRKGKITKNELTLSEQFTEYRTGLKYVKGKKSKTREREMGDPIGSGADPLDFGNSPVVQ